MSNHETENPTIKPEREVIEATPIREDDEQRVAGGEGDSAESESVVEEPRETPARGYGSKWGVAALVLAVIALLLTLTVAGLGYDHAKQLEHQLSTLPSAIERNAGRIGGLEQRIQALQTAIDTQQAALERQSRGLEEAIDALRAQLGRDQSGWVLAEIEYLMLIANHRLQLERDVTTAIAALQIADTRLRDAGDPALIGVREKLAVEIAALDTLARPDITGLALRLVGLGEQVERLPLKGTFQPTPFTAAERTATAEEGSAWQRLTRGVWNDLKGLVTVRRNEEAVRPMLAPEQQYFLRQNLRLQLESARLALIKADSDQFDAALKTAQEWLGRYFDDRADATRGMQEALVTLASMEIRPSLPDISGSLKALRAHMRQAVRQE